MASSRWFTDYLLSRINNSGLPLVQIGVFQTEIPMILPGQEVAMTVGPAVGHEYEIIYHARFDPTMVPGTVYLESSINGVYFVSGLMRGPELMAEGFDTLIFLSERSKMYTRVVNQSPLIQFYREMDQYLIVRTADDFKQVLYELDKLTTRPTTDALALLSREAATLRDRLEKAFKGESLPPFPGGGGR